MVENTVRVGDYFVVTRGPRYLIRKGVADQFRELEIANYDCSHNDRVFVVLLIHGSKMAVKCVFDGDGPSGNVGQKYSFDLDEIEVAKVSEYYAKALIGES